MKTLAKQKTKNKVEQPKKWPIYHNEKGGCSKIALYTIHPDIGCGDIISAKHFLPLTWNTRPFINGEKIVCGSCGKYIYNIYAEHIDYKNGVYI